MGTSLFEHEPPPALPKDVLGGGTAVLDGFAHDIEDELVVSLKLVVGQSPFRNMITPGGLRRQSLFVIAPLLQRNLRPCIT